MATALGLKNTEENIESVNSELLERLGLLTVKRVKLENKVRLLKAGKKDKALIKSVKREEAFIGKEARRLVGVLMSLGESERTIKDAIYKEQDKV